MTRKKSRFQFHKGTIKTSMFLFVSSGTTNFNSIKVRLKRKVVNLLSKNWLYFNSIKVRLKRLIFIFYNNR